MKTTEFEPRLYIVMREDLWDMNPGKGMAQAAHAQADFDAYTENNYTDEDFRSAHIQWCEDRNFGTTLVVSAHGDEFENIIKNTSHADIVVDPTYPYRNWYGKPHTVSATTCMWVFVYAEEDVEYMKKFTLHG